MTKRLKNIINLIIFISILVYGIDKITALPKETSVMVNKDTVDTNTGVSLDKFINGQQIKYLLENTWIYDKYYIRENNKIQNSPKSVINFIETHYSNKTFSFKENAVYLDTNRIGCFDVKFMYHIDSINTYEGMKYNIDQYSAFINFVPGDSLIKGEFVVYNVSDMTLSLKKENNGATQNRKSLKIVFLAKDKKDLIKKIREDCALDSLFY